jgi:hypothetical protein
MHQTTALRRNPSGVSLRSSARERPLVQNLRDSTKAEQATGQQAVLLRWRAVGSGNTYFLAVLTNVLEAFRAKLLEGLA